MEKNKFELVCSDLAAELFNFQFIFKCKSGTIRREQRNSVIFL